MTLQQQRGRKKSRARIVKRGIYNSVSKSVGGMLSPPSPPFLAWPTSSPQTPIKIAFYCFSRSLLPPPLLKLQVLFNKREKFSTDREMCQGKIPTLPHFTSPLLPKGKYKSPPIFAASGNFLACFGHLLSCCFSFPVLVFPLPSASYVTSSLLPLLIRVE